MLLPLALLARVCGAAVGGGGGGGGGGAGGPGGVAALGEIVRFLLTWTSPPLSLPITVFQIWETSKGGTYRMEMSEISLGIQGPDKVTE